jgi:uncharacterized membrane protein YdjX (TVP38/TMEM64 family)
MKTAKIKRWIPPLALAAAVLALYVSGAFNMLDFHAVQAQREIFAAFARRHYWQAMALFSAVYIAGLVCCIPVGMVMGLLSGYMFGLWVGVGLVVFSSMVGGTILFKLAKTSFGGTLRRKMGRFYMKIEKNMQENAISYLLFMRLVPVLPYPVINILPALFNISFRTFFITSVIGMLPGAFVLVNLGRELADIQSPADLFSPGLLAAFGLLGVLSLLPIAARKHADRRRAAIAEAALEGREAA